MFPFRVQNAKGYYVPAFAAIEKFSGKPADEQAFQIPGIFRSSRRHNVSRVGDFVFGNLSNLIGQQGNDCDGPAGERHKFHRAALATFMKKHDGANVTRAQAVFRQVGRQHHAVEFFDHVIHPTDTP
jgi:hypothetical protein